jgi:L,D-transpeptidase ErfK/SrfK
MNSKLNFLALVVFLAFLTIPLATSALTFDIPSNGDQLLGQIQTMVVEPGDTFAIIARRYDVGYTSLFESNPDVDPEAPKPGTVLIIPSRFILPNAPREGLVINLSEMRLYYYPKGTHQVITYPVGVGRAGEETPEGVLKVIEHIKSPTWHVPESIRKIRAAQGVELPKEVPPGPANPLGEYAMRLSNLTYLIHGTNDPYGGIGRRSSSGCLRLYPEDIESLYKMVKQGTNVYIVDEPYKIGWENKQLYLESHIALKQDMETKDSEDSSIVLNLIKQTIKNPEVAIDWNKAKDIAKEEQGVPQVIGEYNGHQVQAENEIENDQLISFIHMN